MTAMASVASVPAGTAGAFASHAKDADLPAEEHGRDDLPLALRRSGEELPQRAMESEGGDDVTMGEKGIQEVTKSFFDFPQADELAAPWKEPIPFYMSRIEDDPLKRMVITSNRDDGGNKVVPKRELDSTEDAQLHVTALCFSAPMRKINQRTSSRQVEVEEASTVEPTSTLRDATLRDVPDTDPRQPEPEADADAMQDSKSRMSSRRSSQSMDASNTARTMTSNASEVAIKGRNERRTGTHLLAMELGRNITGSGHLHSFDGEAPDDNEQADPSADLVAQAVERARDNPLYKRHMMDRGASDRRSKERTEVERTGSAGSVSTRERPGVELGGSLWACGTDRARGPCGI